MGRPVVEGNRIKIARLYRGLTQEQLAEKINLKKQELSNYENNKVEIKFETMMLLIKELSFPYKYFTQEDFEIKYSLTFFRSLFTTAKKYKIQQIVKIHHLAKICSILNNYVEFPKLNLPPSDCFNSPEDAANTLRKFWNLENKPIKNIIRLVESHGIVVTKFKTEDGSIDAFSNFIDDTWIIALSENKDTAARIHFDVAHELGHILLHKYNQNYNDLDSITREEFKNMENEANRFASSFLLPKDKLMEDINQYNPNCKLDYFVQIKKIWHVSIAAIIYRLYNLEVIDYHKYTNLFKAMNKKNWLKNEPYDNTISTSQPSLLRDSIDILLDNDVFNAHSLVEEFAKNNLAMDRYEIESLLCLNKDKLKYQTDDNQKLVKLI